MHLLRQTRKGVEFFDRLNNSKDNMQCSVFISFHANLITTYSIYFVLLSRYNLVLDYKAWSKLLQNTTKKNLVWLHEFDEILTGLLFLHAIRDYFGIALLLQQTTESHVIPKYPLAEIHLC